MGVAISLGVSRDLRYGVRLLYPPAAPLLIVADVGLQGAHYPVDLPDLGPAPSSHAQRGKCEH
jgi:hypothetical protein